MEKYPSPCDKCDKKIKDSCDKFRRCEPWLTRYRYRQKQINAYARKLQEAEKEAKQELIKPCIRCQISDYCDFPCKSYLRWYNARMEAIRNHLGYEIQEEKPNEPHSL